VSRLSEADDIPPVVGKLWVISARLAAIARVPTPETSTPQTTVDGPPDGRARLRDADIAVQDYSRQSARTVGSSESPTYV
jgi:hypothetical protein